VEFLLDRLVILVLFVSGLLWVLGWALGDPKLVNKFWRWLFRLFWRYFLWPVIRFCRRQLWRGLRTAWQRWT